MTFNKNSLLNHVPKDQLHYIPSMPRSADVEVKNYLGSFLHGIPYHQHQTGLGSILASLKQILVLGADLIWLTNFIAVFKVCFSI